MSQPRNEITTKLIEMLDAAESLPEVLCGKHSKHVESILHDLDLAQINIDSLIRCTGGDEHDVK